MASTKGQAPPHFELFIAATLFCYAFTVLRISYVAWRTFFSRRPRVENNTTTEESEPEVRPAVPRTNLGSELRAAAVEEKEKKEEEEADHAATDGVDAEDEVKEEEEEGGNEPAASAAAVVSPAIPAEEQQQQQFVLVASPQQPAPFTQEQVAAIVFEVVGRVLDDVYERGGTGRRALLLQSQSLAWNGYNSAYPRALLTAGESVPNGQGRADTTPKERGAFWHLYNAQRHGAGRYHEYLEEVMGSIVAATAANGAQVQP